ncbi:TadE/TadG family type IV pilus assembly protein [Roseovarius sp. Pro17]|uniref:TadE/TadG family type IV pilus assembly protein n=1 Tax=Roseovarius sp. Pro17 TaxID=3108175 RepID=UPI002D771292|nr:pilus assembly protein TadG-related protein [Roseovarius sp. Pro17]
MSSKIRKARAVFLASRARRLSTDEDGAVVVFTLFTLIMMLIAGGLAIDLMRHEMERARLQNTLDSAVLAAAGAPFGSSPKDIVIDYMAKAEMSSYLNEIKDSDVVQTLNTSKLSASAKMTMDTHLMRLVGVDQLSAPAASSAERRVPKLEVAMVLDVSGSMGSNSKLVNLKKAGKKFVTTILNSATLGDAVISVVPFSWDVSPGENIIESLDVDIRHDYSTCLQFTNDDFNSPAIDPAEEQIQLIYTSEYDYGIDNLNDVYRTCYNEPNAEILPYSISETDLHTKIDSMVAKGNTSGNMGMKWGAALLDPKFEDIKIALNNKTDDGTPSGTKLVDDRVGKVPAAYNESETLKVIVMMGDGQNTYSNQFPLVSDFRGADSFLHYVEWEELQFDYAYHKYKSNKRKNDESYCSKKKWECEYKSVSHSSYFLFDPDDNKYKNLNTGDRLQSWEFDDLLTSDGFVSHDHLTWEKAWGKMSPDFMDKENGYRVAEIEFESSTNRVQGSEKDAQMGSICTAIKNQGVVVYTIGFEVSKGGTAETELKKCATSEAHYYRAQGIDITDAFNSIASNVVNLRLTQ